MRTKLVVIVIVVAALVLIAGLVLDPRSTLAAYLVAWVAIGAIRISNFGIRCKTLTSRSSTGNDSLRLLPELCDRSKKVVARKISPSESGSEVAKEC